MDKNFFSVLVCLALIMGGIGMALANPDPSGASFDEINTSRSDVDSPSNHSAIAGNVTELDITGFTTTQSWQGYYGNVSGTIELANAGDSVLYNWSVASPEGEVYASVNDSVEWTSINCFNLSDTTLLNNLETTFGIDSGDVDGVDETFSLSNHAEFFVGKIQFTSGNCSNTQLFDDSGSGSFDEVILVDGDNKTVFASLLQEDATGFDGDTTDFEMLVPEDGHGTDESTTQYYFYVELE